MHSARVLLARPSTWVVVLLAVAASPAARAAGGGRAPAAAPIDPRAVLATHCSDCHGGGSARGDVDLDAALTAGGRADRALWDRVLENVRNGVMPPPGKPRPTAAEQTALQAFIQRDVQGVDCRAPDPGRVTLRRLNRDEYNHSIADLFGIDFQPAEDFPPDDSGYGFDNIGDVLGVSPVLTEKYFNAAEQVVARVIAPRPEVPRRTLRRGDLKVVDLSTEKVTISEGRFTLEHGGSHAVALAVSVNSFRPFTGRARVRVELDGRPLARASYRAGNLTYRYARQRTLAAGEHAVRFVLDTTRAEPDAGRVINIGLEELTVRGPLGTRIREYPPAHRRLFFPGPPAADVAGRRAQARAILEGLASRAFRRPVDGATLDRLVALAEAAEGPGGRFETGVASAVAAILVSPRFLFRVEGRAEAREKAGQTPVQAPGPGGPTRLDEHSLATRLSYLLHATGPDAELTALAARGALRDNLAAQVRRLLADRRSDRFVSRFVGQWLQTRDVESVPISTERFRPLTPAIRRLMRSETELLFAHLLREDRDLVELITADYSFLNAPLAAFYGLPAVEGPQMRKVALPPDGPRGGLLTHGSFLTVTSNPTRTSPVKRGLFLLDNVLGMPPPPPPPDIPSLDEPGKKGAPVRTMREQLAAHRADPACAGCHARMDPIGLALEGFDAVGRWRTEENGAPLDTSGRLVTGEAIAGLPDLRRQLAARREQLYRTVTRKLLVFALGRGLEPADACTVDKLVAELVAGGGRLSGLLVGIAQSPPFQMRKEHP